jgi:T3SS (YopN, CesT) and YbjN peptide-binding chaperone 1
MADERIVQQVSGILGMNNVNFMTMDDQQGFAVPAGSAGVFINLVDAGERTLIGLRSIVLEQVGCSVESRLKLLEAINEKNQTVPFGCFYLEPDQGWIVYDYHALGDQLQAQELMTALSAIASTADKVDDELRDAIGSGVRALDAWQAAQGSASEPEGAGPVVDT